MNSSADKVIVLTDRRDDSPSTENGLDRFRYRADGCWRWPRGGYSGPRNRALAQGRRMDAWHIPPTCSLSVGPAVRAEGVSFAKRLQGDEEL